MLKIYERSKSESVRLLPVDKTAEKQSEGVRFCLFGTQNTYRLLFRWFCPLG